MSLFRDQKLDTVPPNELTEVDRIPRADGDDAIVYGTRGHRLEIAVDGREVWMQRQWGQFHLTPLTFPVEGLDALEPVLHHWWEHHSDWAAYYSSPAGWPPGHGAYYYQAPGNDGEQVRVGVSVPGYPESGKEHEGEERTIPFEAPTQLAPQARIIGEIRRYGEPTTPPEGQRVGLTSEVVVDDTVLRLDARRTSGTLWDASEADELTEPGRTPEPTSETPAVWIEEKEIGALLWLKSTQDERRSR